MSVTYLEWPKNSGVLEVACTSLWELIVKFLEIFKVICETQLLLKLNNIDLLRNVGVNNQNLSLPILLQYTIIYTLIVVILVYNISMMKILYNSTLLCISSQVWIQWLHIGSLKYATVEVLTLQKSVNATNQRQIYGFVYCLCAEAERSFNLISKIYIREK